MSSNHAWAAALAKDRHRHRHRYRYRSRCRYRYRGCEAQGGSVRGGLCATFSPFSSILYATFESIRRGTILPALVRNRTGTSCQRVWPKWWRARATGE